MQSQSKFQQHSFDITFNTVPIKIPTDFPLFTELEQTNSKIHLEPGKTGHSKRNPGGGKKGERHLDLKLFTKLL